MTSRSHTIVGIFLGLLFASAAFFGYGRITAPKTPIAPTLPDTAEAVLTHVAGPVFVIRDDESLPAGPGDVLQPGDIVKVTDGAVAQVQLADQGTARLGSETLVRFLKMTGADRQLEVRTEILTGSLSYAVRELDDGESIIILADGTEYEIKGTQFLVEKDEDGTRLLVAEGTVETRGPVAGGQVFVQAGEALIIPKDSVDALPRPITKEEIQELQNHAPLPEVPFASPNAPETVLFEIRTEPGDTDIYIDGLKTGRGRFRALLPKEITIDLRLRRRGFRDQAFTVTTDANTYLDIVLEPENLEESLLQANQKNPLIKNLQADYEKRLAEIQARYDLLLADSEQLKSVQESLNEERQLRIQERSQSAAREELAQSRADVLEVELADSRAENEKLKDVIRQIQEIATE
ncbi:MAG: FecR domain-containing protein [Spirochaetales bacterium]|nr:FecR domain-containing protein [Spirochaetales bacterium]